MAERHIALQSEASDAGLEEQENDVKSPDIRSVARSTRRRLLEDPSSLSDISDVIVID